MGLLDDIMKNPEKAEAPAADTTTNGSESHPADLLRDPDADVGGRKFTDAELDAFIAGSGGLMDEASDVLRDYVQELAGDLRAMRDHDRIQQGMLDDAASEDAIAELTAEIQRWEGEYKIAIKERDQARADLEVVRDSADQRIALAIAKARADATDGTAAGAEIAELKERLRRAHEQITVLQNRGRQ